MATVDTANWSGEGLFTQIVLEWLRRLDAVTVIRVEDAPASRSEADYNFISNEIYVAFATTVRVERSRRFGVLPVSREIHGKAMTLSSLEQAMAAAPEIGPADYSDEGMIQFLKTERVIPPYQTRGYKLVELLRVYEIPGS